MQVKSSDSIQFAIPEQILKRHYDQKLPKSFCQDVFKRPIIKSVFHPEEIPSLLSANLPKVLDWLHKQEKPLPLENEVCNIPVLLYDKALSTEKLLLHYDGSPTSAELIRKFVNLFEDVIQNSKATIISPSFIPKSKLKEEEEIIQLVSQFTAETSFIKFNFNRIGDFWSYAVKNEFTLLVTSKNHQVDLAKVLFHFYKGGMWYDRLSFYLSL